MGILSSIDIDFWRSLFDSPLKVIVNSLDILIVAFLIYRFIRALRGTKIMTLVQGVVLFILVKLISDFIGFTTISYLMNQVINYGAIAAVVIFAPELRSALETFGRTPQHFLQNKEVSSDEKLVQAYVKAVKYMSPRKIGALVSIEQTQTLQEQIVTGIPLDAVVTGELLINIFIPNTPLHDGAVIIRGNRITSATCYLPLSDNMQISKDFGTRHRAALGMSEVCDALVIVVSEETGQVSVAMGGQLVRGVTPDYLGTRLCQIQYRNGDSKKFSLRKGRRKDEDA